MKKSRHIILSLFVVLVLTGLLPEKAGTQLISPPLRVHLRQGIEKALNLEFASALASFRRAVELDREDPLPAAFLSLTHLFAGEMSYAEKERQANHDSMLRYSEEAFAKGQKKIDKNAEDGQAHFAMGLASFVKLRWAVNQKSKMMVGREAVSTWEYMQKARAAHPQDYDILLPIGIFHYHIDFLAGFTRFLTSLFITSGDRRLGLQEVELAAQKGVLFKELAAAELSTILINYEKQPERALPFILGLREQFPQNYNFTFALATIYSELQRFDEAFAVARELEAGIQAGKAPLGPHHLPRLENLMGKIFFTQGNYAKAAESFQKAVKDASPFHLYTRASAFLYLGMIHDVRKERKRAREYYSRVMEMDIGRGNIREQAKKYHHDPYVAPPRDKAAANGRK